jgi:hypothetical protein
MNLKKETSHAPAPFEAVAPTTRFVLAFDGYTLLCCEKRLAVPSSVEVSAKTSSQFEAGLDSYLALQQQNELVANIVRVFQRHTSFPAGACS